MGTGPFGGGTGFSKIEGKVHECLFGTYILEYSGEFFEMSDKPFMAKRNMEVICYGTG